MKRSRERILTTHTGSLPRPSALVALMFATEERQPVDPVALHERVRAGVRDLVGRQSAHLDVLNDGGASKPSYAAYVEDRLHGFGGESNPLQHADLVDFSAVARRVFEDPGWSRRKAPACHVPIAVRDRAAVTRDLDNLRRAPFSRRAGTASVRVSLPKQLSARVPMRRQIP